MGDAADRLRELEFDAFLDRVFILGRSPREVIDEFFGDALENEMRRLDALGQGAEWRTNDGRLIPVCEMARPHLDRTIAMLDRVPAVHPSFAIARKWLEILRRRRRELKAQPRRLVGGKVPRVVLVDELEP